jgi:hypothetical protein
MRTRLRLTTVNAKLRCVRITPAEDTKKQISDLKSVAFSLNAKQAAEWATALNEAVCSGLDTVLITGTRKPMRDGSYRVTVTGYPTRPHRRRRFSTGGGLRPF